MSDPSDHDPDPAALEELMRAFGGDDGADSPERHEAADDAEAADIAEDADIAEHADIADDADIAEHADSTGEPAEIFIVEQEPLVDPVDPTPEPPTVIRIDDYSGSTAVEPVAATAPDTVAEEITESDDDPVVISIEDEFPDAVYVEGNLERSGSRSIVFIEDDDTGDTIAPDVERDVRRGIEPRLRERRAAVKRAIGRKRLRWLLLATVVIVVGVGSLAVLGSGLFAIRAENVTVQGAVYADPELVDAVVADLVGTPALLADSQAAEEALEAIPWVDEARVRVSFPHSASIEIRERAAQAMYRGPDQLFRVLDRDGRVLAVREKQPIAYVLLAGPDPVDLEPGQFAPQGYAAASELAKNLTSSIRGQVDRIEVTSDGARLSIFLDDRTEVRFGEARDLFNKLLRLETTLANHPDREPGVIDVSTSEVTL